jgi:hypothetical protein
MKKIFVLLFVFSFNILFSQDQGDQTAFPKFSYGIYSGINFSADSEIGGIFLIELKANLITDLNLNASLGYSKSFKSESYTVKTYSSPIINGTTFYNAEQYDVNEKGYGVIPFSLGFQYTFKNQTISPYLLFELSYNLIIDSKIYRSPGFSFSYSSFEAMPDDYKTKHIETFPSTTHGIILGVGAIYKISSKLYLDLRYFYKYDSGIVNTHQLIVGVSY